MSWAAGCCFAVSFFGAPVFTSSAVFAAPFAGFSSSSEVAAAFASGVSTLSSTESSRPILFLPFTPWMPTEPGRFGAPFFGSRMSR